MESKIANENLTTAWDYLQGHLEMERLAREKMPYDPKECTFEMGPIRQPLFGCLTCQREQNKLNVVCYACSIKCHSSHELVELFNKRGRTCDCGTDRVLGPCFVRNPKWSKLINDDEFKYEPDISDSSNVYGHNFEGRFCDCDQEYNPMVDSNMIQCILGIACDEDWYHEECIMGLRPGVIERNPRRNKSLNGIKEEDEEDQNLKDGNMIHLLSQPSLDAELDQKKNHDNECDDDELDLIPLPGFPDLESFETLICWKCVNKCKADMLVLVSVLSAETVKYIPSKTFTERISTLHGHDKILDSDLGTNKRVKREYPFTVFLKENYKIILTEYMNDKSNEGTGLFKFLQRYPFMYQDEPNYQPPEDTDEDDDSSIYDLGLKEIKNLPADQAALGIMAMNKLQTKLKEFLTPFAKDGGIVTEDAVNDFFKREMK